MSIVATVAHLSYCWALFQLLGSRKIAKIATFTFTGQTSGLKALFLSFLQRCDFSSVFI